jgi:lipoate-protein ligase A
VRRTIRLVAERFPGRPGLDAAISRMVLRRVADGEVPETLRLYVPDRLVAFGSRDAVNPAFEAAKQAAAALGFGTYLRLAGGRAAVFHEHTIAFGWAIPSAEPRTTIRERFDEIGAILVDALTSLGVDARIGEVPGEYCPGSSSVNAGGTSKLAGVGQRLVAGATHVGGVVVVDRPDLVNRVLEPVYGTLGYAWDPTVTGAVARHASADVPTVLAAIRDVIGNRHDLVDARLDATTLEEASGAADDPPRR